MKRYTAEQHRKFKELFGWSLAKFWDFTGFDVIAFDTAVKTPDGISCCDHIRKEYGDDAVALVMALL